jgi:hypothetical protein
MDGRETRFGAIAPDRRPAKVEVEPGTRRKKKGGPKIARRFGGSRSRVRATGRSWEAMQLICQRTKTNRSRPWTVALARGRSFCTVFSASIRALVAVQVDVMRIGGDRWFNTYL